MNLTIDPKNQKQLTYDEIARSMMRAGIGKLYHDKKLEEFGKVGKDIHSFTDQLDEFTKFINSGKGFSVSGSDPAKSYDLFVVMAKATRLLRLDVRVLNILSINEYLQHSNSEDFHDQRFERFESVKGLFVTRVFEPMDKLPLPRSDLYRVENYLSSLMESGLSVSIHYHGKLNESGWWSPFFINRLKMTNREVFLK